MLQARSAPGQAQLQQDRARVRAAAGRGSGFSAPPPPSRTDWTRLVPPPVLTGHVSSRSPHGLTRRHTPRPQRRAGPSIPRVGAQRRQQLRTNLGLWSANEEKQATDRAALSLGGKAKPDLGDVLAPQASVRRQPLHSPGVSLCAQTCQILRRARSLCWEPTGIPGAGGARLNPAVRQGALPRRTFPAASTGARRLRREKKR